MQVAESIVKYICNIENKEFTEEITNIIATSMQPCRFEKIPNREETIVLDVCHNIDGFKAVMD